MSFGKARIEGEKGRELYRTLNFYRPCFSYFACLIGLWDRFNATILEKGYKPSRNGQGLEKSIALSGYKITFYLEDGWNYVLDEGWAGITRKSEAEKELEDHPSYSWSVRMKINRRYHSVADVYGAIFEYPNSVRTAILEEIAVLSGYGLVFTAYFDQS
jgi:hypothetical protein